MSRSSLKISHFALLSASLAIQISLKSEAIAALPIEGPGQTVPGGGASQAGIPIPNEAAWNSAFDSFAQWSQTEQGMELLAASPELKGIANIAQARDAATAGQKGDLAAIWRAADRTELGARLRENLAKLAAAPKADQARLFHAVARDLESAGKSAAQDLPRSEGTIQGHSEALAQLHASRSRPSADVDASDGNVVQARGSGAQVSGRGSVEAESRGPKPLPAPKIVKSSLKSVDEAFDHYVSHSYPGHPGADPIQLTADYIDRYIAFKGMPNSEKHLVLKYYEIGDPRIDAAVDRLVAAKIRTTIITDINQSMEGVFPNDELHNTDFEKATYKNSPPGQSMRHFREHLGFGFNKDDGPFTILSGVPLFNPRDKGEKPLMHDKGAAAQGPNGQAYDEALNGSANMNKSEDKTPGPLPAYGGRYNSVYLSKDPAATQVEWDHIQAEIEAFNKRTGPKLHDVPQEPVRIVYGDGSFQEIAFTNGLQNPNDRITDLFTRAADPKNKIKVKRVGYSHFVLTKTDEVEALRKLMDAQPDMDVWGTFDQQFIWLDGYGEAGALANFLVQRPRGGSIFPFRTEYEHRMELYGYQRLLDGADNIDLDAAPTMIHLWHRKLTWVETVEIDPDTGKEVEYIYVFDRSLNNSNHFQSLESQTMFRFNKGSEKAQQIIDSNILVAKAEPQYAIQLGLAIVRDVLARFTQHTPYDIDLSEYVTTTIDALSRQDYGRVRSILQEVAGLHTKLIRKVDPSKFQDHLEKFIGFLNWYADEAKSDSSLNRMTYKKAVNVAVGLVGADGVHGLKDALSVVYFNPKRSKDDTQALMRKAWTEGLHMTEPFPEPRPADPSGDDKAPVHSGHKPK